MAADVEDLGDFLVALDALFDRIQRSLHNKDPIGVEHCKMKLENYIGIVAMSVALIEDNTTSNIAPRETDATSSPTQNTGRNCYLMHNPHLRCTCVYQSTIRANMYRFILI